MNRTVLVTLIVLAALAVPYPSRMVRAQESAPAQEEYTGIWNLRKLAVDASPKRVRLDGEQVAITLVLTASARQELKGRNLFVRVFRGSADKLKHNPFREDEDGCYIYYAQLITPSIDTSGMEAFRATSAWLHLQQQQQSLIEETWLLVLEEASRDNADVIKIRRGAVERYFDNGFEITLSPNRPIRSDEIHKIIDHLSRPSAWAKLESVKCRDARLLTAASEDPGRDDVSLLATVDCNQQPSG